MMKNIDKVRTILIVLNYNDYRTCIDFIERVHNYSSVDRIIVVDNCSSDNSIMELKKYDDEIVTIIQTDHNGGYAYGNNYGIKYAIEHFRSLETIVISNPDIHIKDEDIIKILESLKNGYCMATGLIYNYDKVNNNRKLASNFGWRVPTYYDMLTNCLYFSYRIRRYLTKTSFYLNWNEVKNDSIIETECVPGCFFIIKKETIADIGLFDERTFLFGEENILGYMLKKYKKKVCIVNDVVIFHENSTSINRNTNISMIKSKLRLNSEIVYLKEYLKCNSCLINIYKMFYFIGDVEKKIIYRINNIFKIVHGS